LRFGLLADLERGLESGLEARFRKDAMCEEVSKEGRRKSRDAKELMIQPVEGEGFQAER
jgi:hypothetical protein